ncbi:MAG: PIG-L deacetylase family protein [Chloroflexota bacterium]
MSDETIRVMLVSPHPDDGEVGAAGTVARWIKEGREVVYVVCTNGDKGSGDLAMGSATLAKTREQEQRRAAEVLGVKEVVFLGYPDGGLEDTTEFRGKLVRLIRQYRPQVVLAPDPYRKYLWHRDHRIAGRVILDAIFPYARDHLHYPEFMTQGLAPHKVSEVYLWGSDEPDTFIDITETFPIKMAAVRCHVSQFSNLGRDAERWLRERAEKMGGEHNMGLAEAFHYIEITF